MSYSIKLCISIEEKGIVNQGAQKQVVKSRSSLVCNLHDEKISCAFSIARGCKGLCQ